MLYLRYIISLREEKETIKGKEAWQKTLQARGQGLCFPLFYLWFFFRIFKNMSFWFQGECDVGSPKLTVGNTKKYTGSGSKNEVIASLNIQVWSEAIQTPSFTNYIILH